MTGKPKRRRTYGKKVKKLEIDSAATVVGSGALIYGKPNAKASVEAVHLAGCILEVVAEYVADGKQRSPLFKVLKEAELRASHSSLRRLLGRIW